MSKTSMRYSGHNQEIVLKFLSLNVLCVSFSRKHNFERFLWDTYKQKLICDTCIQLLVMNLKLCGRRYLCQQQKAIIILWQIHSFKLKFVLRGSKA